MGITVGQWSVLCLGALYLVWALPKLVAASSVAYSGRFHWSRSGYVLDDTRHRMESIARLALIVLVPVVVLAITSMTSGVESLHAADAARLAELSSLVQ